MERELNYICCTPSTEGLEVFELQREARVRLNVYDAADDRRVQVANALFRAVGAGAYHAGVEVYGLEWSFGGTFDRGATGVFSCTPKQSPSAGRFLEAINLGGTEMSQDEVLEATVKLEREWLGEDYDLVSRNCCHFCRRLLQVLGAGPMPAWVTNLAGTGEALRNGAQAVQQVASNTMPSIIGFVQAGVEAAQRLGNAIDVVLECKHSAGMDLTRLDRWERCITLRVVPGRPELIGPLQQPDAFKRFQPSNVERAQVWADAKHLFELEWQPPCLFLRKPKPDTPLLVGGVPVRQQTYVLLNHSEIGICRAHGEKAQLVLKVDRTSGTRRLQADRFWSSLKSKEGL